MLAQLLHLEARRRPVAGVPATVLAPAVLSAVLAAKLLTTERGRPARPGHGIRARVRVPRQACGRGLLLRRQHVLLMLLCGSAVAAAVAAASSLLEILAAVAPAGNACQNGKRWGCGTGTDMTRGCYKRVSISMVAAAALELVQDQLTRGIHSRKSRGRLKCPIDSGRIHCFMVASARAYVMKNAAEALTEHCIQPSQGKDHWDCAAVLTVAGSTVFAGRASTEVRLRAAVAAALLERAAAHRRLAVLRVAVPGRGIPSWVEPGPRGHVVAVRAVPAVAVACALEAG